MHRICIAACAAVFLSLIAGCGSTRHLPATLKAQSFAPPANAAPAQNNGGGVTQVAKAATPPTNDDSPISAAVPATRPSTRPAIGASSGTFMYIGTVVAEVNG